MEKEYREFDIELKSDEVQEIIHQSPRWMVRSGLTLIFGVIVLLFIGSFFFSYPDTIKASIVVVTDNPPVYLVARTTARIDTLSVTDKQMVSEGQVIAVLNNPANFSDVVKVKEMVRLQEAFMSEFDTLTAIHPETNLQLGDLQSDYSSFVRLFNEYFAFSRLQLHPRKIKALRKQVSMSRIYYDRLWMQKMDMEADYKIATSQYKRDSILKVKSVLSELDLETSQTNLIQKKYNLTGARIRLAETQSTILQQEQNVVDAEIDYTDQLKKMQNTLIESFNVLKSRMVEWEQRYVLQSPISGTVSFTSFWSKNQEVKEGELVFTVVPEKQSQIVGRLSLPVAGAGKVAVGQSVNIRFDNFPYMEYGFVKGKIKSISMVYNKENYTVEVEIPQDIRTNYNIPLKFSPEMKGTAEIITEDLKLIERFFNPIRSVLKHRVSPPHMKH